MNWISRSGVALGSQSASASISSRFTVTPSSRRKRFSRRIFRENGSRERSRPEFLAKAARE